ncbi:MAG: type II CRISPR-associated endonuclease Cas1 [Clostridia bacterium]|nr:type II CRISPR-associated endonuclease Cas1 [Clostridia bacterium]
MPFINVFIESPCNVSVKNASLVLKNDENCIEYPLEDVNCVMIDCLYNNVSVYAMNKLCENGATVIVCDDKHLPSSVLLPFNKYYKRLTVIENQFNASKPKIKTLWQNIVKKKISNQGDCLRYNGIEGDKYLYALSKNVLSGDSENAEAQAAAFYFKRLFGEKFSRNEDNFINACLNYCYTIVRSLICRHISARGFEGSLGIFHKSRLNNFNLADDLIEPFRPIADNFVYNVCGGEEVFSPEIKKRLFGIVNLNVKIKKEVHALSYAVERMSESLLSFYDGKSSDIILSEIYDLNMHVYE